jgi:hypothetical protein
VNEVGDNEKKDATALLPLARAAAKAFGDRNAVVNVNHAVKRLADAKALPISELALRGSAFLAVLTRGAATEVSRC